MFDLTDSATGKGMTIVMWETEADMKAAETSGYYREQVAKVALLLCGPPSVERYQVSIQG